MSMGTARGIVPLIKLLFVALLITLAVVIGNGGHGAAVSRPDRSESLEGDIPWPRPTGPTA